MAKSEIEKDDCKTEDKNKEKGTENDRKLVATPYDCLQTVLNE